MSDSNTLHKPAHAAIHACCPSLCRIADENIRPAPELITFHIQLKTNEGENINSYFTEGLQVRGRRVAYC